MDKTLGILGFGRIGQLVARARAGLRHAGRRLRPVRRRRALPRARRREGARPRDEVYAEADFITLHLPKTPETEGWLDAEAFAKMQGRRARPERRPRPADRRRGPAGRRWTPARSAARRSTSSAPSRSPTTRCSAYPNVDRHAAPRRLDGRGDRPRRLPGRRAGRRRADRRRGHDRRQRAGRRRRGPRGARARSCRSAARSAGSPPCSAEGSRSTASRSSTSAGSPSATRRPLDDRGAARRPRGPHRGGRQRGQRAARSPHERGIEVAETSSTTRARLHRPRARHASSPATAASASSARRSAAATARTCSRPGASASTSSSRTTSRSSATATCPA